MSSATTVDVEQPQAAPVPAAPKRERKLVGLVRRSLGLRTFLSTPVDPVATHAAVCERIANRDDVFLDYVRRLVYDVPQSPYRPLLAGAGWTLADIETAVRQHGVEATLERLRDDGVYVTLDEWKGREPLVRNGVELHLKPEDFDNPLIGRDLEASSSGSSGNASRTPAGWEGLTEAAKRLRFVLDCYGVGGATTALWAPAPPGGSGLLGAIMFTKLGMRPARWFSQTKPRGPFLDRLTTLFLLAASRALGHPLPRPRYTELGQADVVARWLAEGDSPRVLAGFASSAVRVGQVAQELGLDLSGRAVLVGGEPVTPDRQRFLRSLGLQVIAMYGASDAGLIAAGCPNAEGVDDYHAQPDEVAVIAGPGAPETGAVPILVSSLVATGGKVLLNVDIGDQAVLERRPCDCAFGKLGFDLHLMNVRSRAKQTSEGMTVPSRALWEHAGDALAPAGAGRDDYQIWEVAADDGITRVVLAVSPHLEIDADAVVARILDDFSRRDAGSKTAADVWRQAGTLQIVRERPRLSGGGKLLPVLAFDGEPELAIR
jgi:hypothetical protein